MNILDHLQGKMFKAYTNSQKGPEYHGPCPGCSGTDRFHVWPDQDERRGSYWCRQCGKAGDAVQFFRDFHGMTFKEAVRAAGREMSDYSGFRQDAGMSSREFVPSKPADPPGVDRTRWTEAAEKFVERCHTALLADPEKLAWLDRRGVVRDQVIIHRLGWHAGENDRNCAFRAREGWGLPPEKKPDGRNKPLWIPRGLVIPAHDAGRPVRIKIRRPKTDRTERFNLPYHQIPGGRPGMLVTSTGRKVYVIVEAELDAMAVDAAAGDLVTAVGIGTSAAKPDAELFPRLEEAHKILVALDAGDAAGAKASRWWIAQFPRAARWPVVKGKDPGEAVQKGVDLRNWILAGLPPSVMIGCSLKDRFKCPGSSAQGTRSDACRAVSLDSRLSGNETRGGGRRELSDGLDVPGRSGGSGSADRSGKAERPNVPESLTRFFGYLRKYPVQVYAGRESLRLVEGANWSDWDVSKEISKMLFFDPDVLSYVTRHPAETIHRGNFWDGLEAAQ